MNDRRGGTQVRGRIWQVLRLVYHDLRVRNSTVRIAEGDSQGGATEAPIFVVSVYRSGTTLLRFVLDSHSRLAAPPESDFIHLAGSLLHDDGALQGLKSMGFEREHVARRVRCFTDYFHRNYASSWGKPRWVDKSPKYVEHFDLLREIFPDAYFVILHRHPLDQVNSFSKGGSVGHPAFLPFMREGEDLRIGASRYWNERTEFLRARSGLPNVMTLRYEELCASPRRQLERLLRFLGEEYEAEMLDFHAHPHDLGKESVRIRSTTGFDARTSTYVGWEPSMINACWAVVRSQAEALGYGLAEAE